MKHQHKQRNYLTWKKIGMAFTILGIIAFVVATAFLVICLVYGAKLPAYLLIAAGFLITAALLSIGISFWVIASKHLTNKKGAHHV